MPDSFSARLEVDLDAALAERLIAEQFPQWRGLEVAPVAAGGWDNRTFRLGEDLLVRMPAAARYAAQVEKEQAWLPRLGPHLPLPIPVVAARGGPGLGYPWRWSVYRWLPGEPMTPGCMADEAGFVAALGGFLAALHRIPTDGGPVAGAHNFHRGGALAVYDAEMVRAIAALPAVFDRGALAELWAQALASQWSGAPVWVHGDIAPGNLLVSEGRLSAVIDFGQLGVGDPACDLAICWTSLRPSGARALRNALPLDRDTWRRAQGWAAWKAAILSSGVANGPARAVQEAEGVLTRVLDDFRVG